MGKIRGITYHRLLEAVERGYFVSDDGKLFGPKGEIKISIGGKQRYPTFSTNWGGRVFGIPVHYLAAFCFYGEATFDSECIRHLNGDTLDVCRKNIVLGTHAENENDKSKEVKSRSAKAARAAQGRRAHNAKLTPNQVREIRLAYDSITGKAPQGFMKTLMEKYGVSNTTITKVKNGEIYCDVN